MVGEGKDLLINAFADKMLTQYAISFKAQVLGILWYA